MMAKPVSGHEHLRRFIGGFIRTCLVGVRCVVASETSEGGRLNEDVVKKLTGGDSLTGRFLHKEYFDFDPSHKTFLVTNHKPTIRGRDHAMWRRVALAPFTVRFWKPEDHPPPGAPLADLNLVDTLLMELPGILMWAVRGCLAWQHDGRLRLPRLVRVATAEYQAEQDLLGPFLEDCCIVPPPEWVRFDELYTSYESFAKRANERLLTKTAFGRELTARGFKERRLNGQRGRLGPRLRLDSDPPPTTRQLQTAVT